MQTCQPTGDELSHPVDAIAQDIATKFLLEEYRMMRAELVAENTMQSQHAVALMGATAVMVLFAYQLTNISNGRYLQTGLLTGSAVLGTLAWAAERHGLTGWLIAQYFINDLIPLIRRTMRTAIDRELADRLIGWEDFAKNTTRLRPRCNAAFLFALIFISNQVLRRVFFILPAVLALAAALLAPYGALRLPTNWWDWLLGVYDFLLVLSFGPRLFVGWAFYRGLGQ